MQWVCHRPEERPIGTALACGVSIASNRVILPCLSTLKPQPPCTFNPRQRGGVSVLGHMLAREGILIMIFIIIIYIFIPLLHPLQGAKGPARTRG